MIEAKQLSSTEAVNALEDAVQVIDCLVRDVRSAIEDVALFSSNPGNETIARREAYWFLHEMQSFCQSGSGMSARLTSMIEHIERSNIEGHESWRDSSTGILAARLHGTREQTKV